MFALPDLASPQSCQRSSVPSLSGRQLECLAWTQEGKSAYDIGMILGLSARTVEGHLAKACRTLGVRRRIQAVIRARELGLLGRAEP